MRQGLTTYQKLITRNLSSIFSFFHLSLIQGVNVLIQLLLIPIITRSIGLASFGEVMVAASYASLVSLVVNFGSNQSGIKDVAINKENTKELAETFYVIFGIRFLFFFISLFSLVVLYLLHSYYTIHFLMANAIILSEVLNPLFFYAGLQSLFLYNLTNFVAKIVSAILIVLFVKSAHDSIWINFFLGIPNAIGFLILCISAIKKYNLEISKIPYGIFKTYISKNIYLAGNNILVQLQQSFFLFSISGIGNPLLLGAYSLCDKIVWSFRILIISISVAVYPKSVSLFQTAQGKWSSFKRKINYLLFGVFICIGLLLFFFSDWIILIITGVPDQLASSFVKAISFVPLVSALNVMNVIDMLIREHYRTIFGISLIIISVAILTTEVFIFSGNTNSFGFYPIIVELCALPLYLYYIKKNNNAASAI